MKVKVANLVFEDAEPDLGLPTEMIVEVSDELVGDEDAIAEAALDVVSEQTGWLVKSSIVGLITE